jgi:putative peptidoglycan lipid II flippase
LAPPRATILVVPTPLRSTGRVSVAVLASRVLGLAREIAFAALFGAGAVADAYTVAFRIPNLLRDLLAEGALSSAFVPTFTATLQNEGKARADALGNLVLSVMLVLTGVLTGLGMIFSEALVVLMAQGFGGDAAKVALAAELTRVMMPILALVSLGAVWMGMLNAQRRFVVPALAPAVFNVVSILAGLVVWWWRGSVEHGVLVWSVGTLLAGVAQAGMLLPSLWRLGYRPALRLRGARSDPGLRRIARLMAPALVGLAAVQINIFVNTGFAGSLGDGAVAQIGYAFRLFFLPLGVFGVALATVTTTHVSEEAAKGDRGALAERVAESTSAGLMLTSASAVGLFVLAVPVTVLVYRHGQTSLADAEAIAWVLQAYVLGLVPYSLVKILAPAFYGVDRPRIPLVASLCAVVVNIVFNALTYRQLGAAGIALGTTLGAVVNWLVLRVAFRRVIGPLPVPQRAARLLALVVANGVLGGVAWGGYFGAQQLLARVGVSMSSTMVLAPVLLVVIGAGFFAYAAVLRALGYPGGKQLWSMPARIFRRGRSRQG